MLETTLDLNYSTGGMLETNPGCYFWIICKDRICPKRNKSFNKTYFDGSNFNDNLKIELSKHEELNDLVSYFEKTFIGEEKRNRNGTTTRKAPLFEHKLWNLNKRVLGNLPRTNNSVESWNKAFSSRICAHPKIYKLIQRLMTEHKHSEANIIRIETGLRKHRKVESELTDERLQMCINKYDSEKNMDFLKNVSLLL